MGRELGTVIEDWNGWQLRFEMEIVIHGWIETLPPEDRGALYIHNSSPRLYNMEAGCMALGPGLDLGILQVPQSSKGSYLIWMDMVQPRRRQKLTSPHRCKH